MDKTQVIGELLTTTETALDTIATVLEGNISEREQGKYVKKMEQLGRSISLLMGIVEGNTSYGVLKPQMESIINKYKVLVNQVEYCYGKAYSVMG